MNHETRLLVVERVAELCDSPDDWRDVALLCLEQAGVDDGRLTMICDLLQKEAPCDS